MNIVCISDLDGEELKAEMPTDVIPPQTISQKNSTVWTSLIRKSYCRWYYISFLYMQRIAVKHT
jgi:hypothetical protein